MLAIINATLLFLGARTNPLADFIGVPLSTYYTFHHFIGRVVVVEGIIHAALAFRRSRPDQTTISGYSAAGLLVALLFTSLYCIRRYLVRAFGKIHLVLALAMLGATIWHVLTQTGWQARVILLNSGGLWVLNTGYVYIRLSFYATGATIIDETGDSEISRITVSCHRPFRHFPGSYFYIFPPGSVFHYSLLTSYPMAALWYEPDSEGEGSTITFLVLHSGPLRSLRFKRGERLLIDGLYGQDLNLESFESVMLAAHGAGIVGVLSIARTLWECRHDNVLCRVNIFWSLDRNSQGERASEYLKLLQNLDSGNELFVVWCVYPPAPKATPLFRETSHWICFDEHDHYPLLEFITACGGPDFSAHVRKAVVDRRADRPVEFVEVQYRPSARLSRAANDKDSEQGTNKLSVVGDVDLEKGRNRSGETSPAEGEDWDEITLCSHTGTPVNGIPRKTWQKKTH
ncbi:hypothetical protein F5883DRAFT_669942 [Diaporthe sp. PMI_573]|nr:hypothetical protein F5883DRAFT_669942 [Diaporthaceae sp. PMI_573]